VADITYIRLRPEFVYLAVLLDAFSRRCIGWALQRTLEAALVLESLRMALTRRRPRPGLVHHSDRGVQYASHDYTAQLERRDIRISMSRAATPYDNAQAESFIKTLKYEEVYRTEYHNLQEAKASIGEFLEKIYTQERLHSALGYRPPLELGSGSCRRSSRSSASMSFQSAIPCQVALRQSPPPLRRLETILN
jgi:putative transposase